MGSKGRLQRVRQVLYAGVSWVYGAPGMETIGLRGRCSEAALCTGSSGEAKSYPRMVKTIRLGCLRHPTEPIILTVCTRLLSVFRAT
jgi:hypothetical protein